MAIGFARFSTVSGTNKKNACCKAAYLSKERVEFHGNVLSEPCVYNQWANHEKPIFHEIFLPSHVDSKFNDMTLLWNHVEQKEVRKNSQVAYEMVLALPDDKILSLEDRKHLVETFVRTYFTEKGMAVQVDIHQPEQKKYKTEKAREIQDDEPQDHNWHAHLLIATRRFNDAGTELEKKARDLMPVVRNGFVVSGPKWGHLWAEHQNTYFEAKGLSLRVDANGPVPQIHLGPVRMRHRAFSLLEENDIKQSLNLIEASDPSQILATLVKNKSLFTADDVERFLHKFVVAESIEDVRRDFWAQENIVQLLDRETHQPTTFFSTRAVIDEERKIDRLIGRVNQSSSIKLSEPSKYEKYSGNLTEEQVKAYNNILSQSGISCIEGHAGTGKSYLLLALKKAYEAEGLVVRTFGPDHATAAVLRSKGLENAGTVHKLLYSLRNNKISVSSRREIWIVDEATKLANKPFLELLKHAENNHVKLIFSGNSAQLSSVDRGGMFAVISQKLGFEQLELIQRQDSQQQKEMTTNLAKGNVSEAIDMIVRNGGINWSDTKQAAAEALIHQWAVDKIAHPNESTLILAHSNKEVRVLNELVRVFRREKGELGEKEYECQTIHGKIFVSTGDKIEFKLNHNEVGVRNGDTGTLIEVSTSKFTVRTEESGHKKDIEFDPRRFSGYQLGYANTYFRSQGKTIDRAYVLHSYQMSKEKFYVGLTRHVKNVTLFISKSDCRNLVELKKQANTTERMKTTMDFTNRDILEKESKLLERRAHIQELKHSDSLFDQFKGAGISTWDAIKDTVTRFNDRRLDNTFYEIRPQETPSLAEVKEVKFQHQEPSNVEELRVNHNLAKHLAAKETSKQVRKQPQKRRQNLPENTQVLLKNYYEVSSKAQTLRTILQATSELDEGKQNTLQDSQELKGLYAARNEAAYQVKRFLTQEEKTTALSAKEIEIIQERATRHENAHLRVKQEDIESKLKEHLDSLLYKLFPEGPSRREAKGLRFRSKGSLSVICQGERMGSYYDHENGLGGGVLSLIQNTLNLSFREARDWAKDFLGYTREVHVPSQFIIKKSLEEKEDSWISMKPPVGKSAPSLSDIHKQLGLRYKEQEEYTYRDKNGEPLFYIYRLVEKADPSKKAFFPVSYGHVKGNESHPKWDLKGYQPQGGGKPIYNLHLIKQFPKAKILIVEGEKTAEAASRMFPKEEMICVTWQGGASAVKKSDWSPLFAREVVIWPDNDMAGSKAASELVQELRKTGMKSISVVDEKILRKEFPEKWDLADSLPLNKAQDIITTLILGAKEKTLGVGQMANPALNKEYIHKLAELENLHWEELESKYSGKNWEVKNEVSSLLSKAQTRMMERALAQEIEKKASLTLEKGMDM